MHKIIALSALLSLALSTSALAAPNRQPAEVNTPSGVQNPTVIVPDFTSDLSAVIIPLGTAIDPTTGKVVEGIKIIHKRGQAKPSGTPGGSKTGSCFAYLAKGAVWKTLENWEVNTTNTEGFDSNFVLDNIAADIQKWEDAAGANIFGSGTATSTDLSDNEDLMDGTNGTYFGNADSSNTIAATTIWGIFGGPPGGRDLVEWDMELNQVNFNWANDGSPTMMDFENIVTHELGHAFGMGHPSSECTEETMYAFAANGETKKRDLNDGDIAGINALY